MEMLPSDPDVETLVNRIRRGELDLQPEFQRGEVWSESKRKRLIDTILREWQFPPVHVIEDSSGKQEVLDGQQRLAAIRDFVEGKLKVDGFIVPRSLDIERLDGKTYSQLPDDVQRRFNRFTLRVFRIVKYQPEEPGEFFFRLNQPTTLTTAEQRNAFFGPVRAQVKRLSQLMETEGLNEEFLGFSNSRMAYDDIVARVCLTLRNGTLSQKITASVLSDLYRSTAEFSGRDIELCAHAIRSLGRARNTIDVPVRMNKATLFSWLCFTCSAIASVPPLPLEASLGKFIAWFESKRDDVKKGGAEIAAFSTLCRRPARFAASLLELFNDRATSRVADVSSVVARDAVLWAFFFERMGPTATPSLEATPRYLKLQKALSRTASETHDKFVESLLESGWGSVP